MGSPFRLPSGSWCLNSRNRTTAVTPTFGNGKICYVELPATDISLSASFYEKVFGWKTRRRGDGLIAFDDGVGQVSGTWVTGRAPAPLGLLIYIIVYRVDASVVAIA